jgi:zinc transport system ATP-binding protein
MKIIEIKNLSFAYQREKVLENISLVVQEGDFLGLIGQNGSGKSTLLKLILGLLQPTKGEILLFGQRAERFSDWSKIGYVAQKSNFDSNGFPVTVAEVLHMTGANSKEIERVLTLSNLSHKKQRLLSELSGGQQQRVFIARALLSRPKLLILDEPTVGVDGNSQTKFYELLRKLNQEEKLTIILVSHDLDVITKEVGQVACINQSLVYHGHPEQLFANDLIEKLYGGQHRLIAHAH